MKYSILTLILLITITAISFMGCNKTEEVTPAPTVSSEPVEGPTEAPAAEPTKTESTGSSIDIPSADKIKGDLKTKADELTAAITEAKDDSEKSAPLEELKKLCTENPSDFALFSYLIESPDGEISKVGMEALEDCYAGKMSDEEKAEEFEILSCAVKHPIDYIRCRALMTMSYVSDSDERIEKQKEIIREALEDKSCHVRITAIQKLGMAGDKEMTDALIKIMNGTDEPQVIAAAMRTLERFEVDLSGKLMEFLEKGDPHIKACAIEILARKKDKNAIPKLITMLDDTTSTVIGSNYDNGITIVYSGLKDTLQGMAIMGLESITGKKFEDKENKGPEAVTAQWKEWYEKNKDVK